MATTIVYSTGAHDLAEPIKVRIYDPTPRYRHGGLHLAAEAARRGGEMGDDILLHVNPQEFSQIKAAWGEPTYNDKTGLPEYGLKRFFKRAGKFGKRLLKNPLVQTLAPIALNMFLPGVGGLIGSSLFGAASSKASGGNPLTGALMGGLGHVTAGGGFGKGPSGALGIVEGEARGAGDVLAQGSEAIENAVHGSQAGSTLGDKFSGFFKNPDGSIRWGRAIGAGAGALGLLGAMGGSGDDAASAPAPPAGWNDPAKYQTLSRTRNPVAPDYFTYGKQGGEHRFFGDPSYTDGATTPPADVTGTGAGAQPATGYVPNEQFLRSLLGRPGFEGGGGVRGPGSGRSDSIEALLSDGEYVMDAESVALLGDGSLDEGAARLDQLRANLRKHKGQALAKGEFSPPAKDPMTYMAEGGYASEKQARLMRAVAHGWKPDRIKGPSRKVANEFVDKKDRGKAKGGGIRRIITGLKGKKAPDEVRLAELESLRRMAEGLKQRPKLIEPIRGFNPPEKKARGGRVKEVEGRIAAIKALSEKHPIKRAEGGPVAEMSELADKLEAALKLGSIPEIDSAVTPVIQLAKGGNIRTAIEAMRAKVNKGLNPIPDALEYLKMKHPQGSPVVDMLEGRRAPPVDTRRVRTPEEIAAEQRILEGVELLRLLKGEKPQ